MPNTNYYVLYSFYFISLIFSIFSGYPDVSLTLKQMNESMREFLNDTNRGMMVDQKKNTITLSHIFSWFQQDFLNQTKSLIKFLSQYVDPKNENYQYLVEMKESPHKVKLDRKSVV